jgi:hypothetical protein
VTQGVGPELKPWYCKKQTNKQKNCEEKATTKAINRQTNK